MKKYIFLATTLLTLASCSSDNTNNNQNQQQQDKNAVTLNDTIGKAATQTLPNQEETTTDGRKKIPVVASDEHVTKGATVRPRVNIKGDFDGDGKAETLTESYINQNNNQPINRSNGRNYAELQQYIPTQKPKTSLTTSKDGMADFLLSDAPNQLGIDFIKNEGDLNGDGTDEISYVINWLDQSTLNRVHIATYKDGAWKELVSFSIRETVLPAYTKKPDFEGLIHAIPNQKGKILVKFVNEGAMEEYAILDLTSPNPKLPTNKPLEQRLEVYEDSVLIPEFTLQFHPTPAVAKLLKEEKETIQFSVDIIGEPRKDVPTKKRKYYNAEEGVIYLMTQKVELTNNTKQWKMKGKVSEQAFLELMNPDLEITVNTYSGRKSSKLNIFDTKTIIEPISNLAGKTKQVKVGLLGK